MNPTTFEELRRENNQFQKGYESRQPEVDELKLERDKLSAECQVWAHHREQDALTIKVLEQKNAELQGLVDNARKLFKQISSLSGTTCMTFESQSMVATDLSIKGMILLEQDEATCKQSLQVQAVKESLTTQQEKSCETCGIPCLYPDGSVACENWQPRMSYDE